MLIFNFSPDIDLVFNPDLDLILVLLQTWFSRNVDVRPALVLI